IAHGSGLDVGGRRPIDNRPQVSNLPCITEEVEVAADVCLFNVVEEEAGVTALVSERRGLEGGETCLDLRCGEVQFETAGGDVEENFVAILDDGERAADGGFGGDV